jgi:hypothetical protein
MDCRWESLGIRRTLVREKLFVWRYFRERKNPLDGALDVKAKETQPGEHRNAGGSPRGRLHPSIWWRYHQKIRSGWLSSMGSKWKLKSSVSDMVRRRAHYQQRVQARSPVKCSKVGKVIEIGTRWLDDYRGFQSDTRVLQPKIQATTEIYTRCINHKIDNQSLIGKGRLQTRVPKIQLVSRLAS